METGSFSVSIMKMINQDLVRLNHFDGTNFTHWLDKLKFLLAVSNLFYVLDPELQPILELTVEDFDKLKVHRKKRVEDQLVCRGRILKLSNRL